MDDTAILNWINDHIVSFRETLMKDDQENSIFEMEYLNKDGESVISQGTCIRSCVRNACK